MKTLLGGLILFVLATGSHAQMGLTQLLEPTGGKLEGDVDYRGKKCVRLTPTDPTNGYAAALLRGLEFKDGVIELEVASTMSPTANPTARGFIGVVFRSAAEAKTYECFYLRPLNARADDQVRRNHTLQYISHPDFPWEKLRKEFPEKYESYTDMEAGAWTKVRVEVKGGSARLFINGAPQPSLIVNDLKLGADRSGQVGLWTGPGTIGHFANFRTTK